VHLIHHYHAVEVDRETIVADLCNSRPSMLILDFSIGGVAGRKRKMAQISHHRKQIGPLTYFNIINFNFI
jgi:hypothetical protein